MQLKKKFLILAGGVALFVTALTAIGWFLVGEVILIPAVGFSLFLVLIFQLAIYQKTLLLFGEQDNNYRQVEALFSIFSTLNVKRPLPQMRGWAASPDLMGVVISLIFETKPKLIVEAGTGVSTILSAYCLRDIGEGRILSLEHDESYAKASVKNLEKHGLSSLVSVAHCPLKEVKLGEQTWSWYDIDALKELQDIDVLVIDGPPTTVGPLSRYPALPLLCDRLSENAIIVMDDAWRKDETEIINRWLKEFAGFSDEVVHTEKGTVILRKVSQRH